MKFSRFALALAVLIPCAAFAQGGGGGGGGAGGGSAGGGTGGAAFQVLQAQLRHLLEQVGLVALLPERAELRQRRQGAQETPD